MVKADSLQSLTLTLDSKEEVMIFADAHLTMYDQEWMNRCGSFIQSFDGTIIILGDFWDGYHITEERFHSEWSGLLEILHKKECIYVPGNHDKPAWNTQSKRFAQKMVASVDLLFPSYRVHCEHGDLLAPDLDWYAPTLSWYLASIPYRWYSFHKPALFGRLAAKKAYAVYCKRSGDSQESLPTLCIGHIHASVLARRGTKIAYLSPGLFRGAHPHVALISNRSQKIVTL